MNPSLLESPEACLDQMIAQQVRTCEVLDPRVLQAMHNVPRAAFVPAALRSLAYADCALPLPLGKRMLTPMIVGRMLQALEPEPGEQVLEIGTGSGYLTACLAAMGARVRTLELHDEIAQFARHNLRATGVEGVDMETADGATLAVDGAYDALVLTGSLPAYDERYARALKRGGRLFVVVGQAPVMEARLVRRLGPGEYSSAALFETTLEALEHVPVPQAFRF
jgi:protein-L-isoaspartate(D-aspartate) O-methyltransferase